MTTGLGIRWLDNTMRRLFKWLRMKNGGFNYRYVGMLPENYPLPGTEFFYRGEYGVILFYCLHIHSDGETATLEPVVSYKGRSDLVYSLDMIFPEIKTSYMI